MLGYGWTLSASSIQRLGTTLDFHPKGQIYPSEITLTDGDGTSHIFRLDKHGSTDSSAWTYEEPAGVNLYLKLNDPNSTDREWVMIRPDRTKFFFDDEGYLSAITDNNGNTMTFTYGEGEFHHKPKKFLEYITDAAGRHTLTFNYYVKGDTVNGESLTNPHIIGKVRKIVDISGRTITFTYNEHGQLKQFVDGAGSNKAKTFKFGYTNEQTNKNTKLKSVTDPRGNTTQLSYYDAGTPAFNKHRLQTMTDRLGGVTTYSYEDMDDQPNNDSQVQATVKDAKDQDTVYLMNGYGYPIKITDTKGNVTRMHWDDDANVDRLEEPNGAVTTWEYNNNGLPLKITDAENNAETTPESTILKYQSSQNGYVNDLVKKTSPEGRLYTFSYDGNGNLLSVTDPKGNATSESGDYTTKYTYNQYGELLTATDANGNATTYSDYGPNGYPGTTTNALGDKIKYDYGKRGQVLSVTDPDGNTSTYTYDLFLRPLKSKVPKDGAKGEYIVTPAPVYDNNDNVVIRYAPNGAKYTYKYDAADQLMASTAPKYSDTGKERKTTYQYDIVGNLKSVTEPKGNLTSIEDDFTTTYQYDPLYQLKAVTNALGQTINYQYDNVGNMIQETLPKGVKTSTEDDYTKTFKYDLDHRLIKQTDEKGYSTTYTYDDDSEKTSVTDKEGHKTVINYNKRGLIASVKVPHKKDSSGNIDYRTTKYVYDEVGNRTKVITPRGTKTSAEGDFTNEAVYDALNRVIKKVLPHDADSSTNDTANITYNFNNVGDLTKVIDPEGNATRTTYFDNGWIKSQTDPWGIKTVYDYNKLGEQTLRTITGAAGSSSRKMGWAYYPDGQLKSKNDSGAPKGLRVELEDNASQTNADTVGKSDPWKTATDGNGYQDKNYQTNLKGDGTDTFTWNLDVPEKGTYKVYVKYPSGTGYATNAPFIVHYTDKTTGETAQKTYNVDETTNSGKWQLLGSHYFKAGLGQKIVLTDKADGIVVADAVKLVKDTTGVTDDEAKQFNYTYNVNGSLIKMTDDSSSAKIDRYQMVYGELGRIQKIEEWQNGADSAARTTTYAYDANGNLTNRTFDGKDDKEIADYTYTERNLVDKIVNKDSADDTDPKVTTYQYTPNGMTKQEEQPNGNVTTYDYYLNQLLKSKVTKKSNGTIVNKHALEYNANGNRVKDTLQLINADGTTVNSVLNYTYDARGRVTKYEKTGDNATTETYQLDLSGNVVKSTKDGKTNTYNYERNRLVSAVLDGTKVDYQYDPYGRLHSVNALTAGQTFMLQHYTYDGFDHVISHKKLKEGTVSDYTTVKYSYDPMDRRVTRTEHVGTSNKETTHLNYLGLSGKVLNEEIAGKITRSYTYSPWGQRLSMVKTMDDGTKETSYYGYNPHTDVEMLYTQDGSVRATYGYSAYGKMDKDAYSFKGKPDVDPNRPDPYNVYRYNSKRWDPHSEDYDMGFRNYSPGLNRFLSRDMYNGALSNLRLTTDPFTMNRYAFAGGNPISMIELDGHIPAYMKEHPEEGFKAWKEVFGESYSQSMVESMDGSTANGSNGGNIDIGKVQNVIKSTLNILADQFNLGYNIQVSSNMKGAMASYIAALARDITGAAVNDHNVQFGVNVAQGLDIAIGTKAYFKPIKEVGTNITKALSNIGEGNGLLSSLGGAFKDSLTKTSTLSTAGRILGKTAGGFGFAISGVATVSNVAQGKYASAAMSGGEALFSAATIAAASGFGAPVAAGLAIAGGITWGVGFVAKNWGDDIAGWVGRRFD